MINIINDFSNTKYTITSPMSTPVSGISYPLSRVTPNTPESAWCHVPSDRTCFIIGEY